MADAYTSDTYNTSNAFIKYQILVTPVDGAPAGTTRINVVIKAWRTNSGYTTCRDGRCDVRIFRDETSSAPQIGSNSADFSADSNHRVTQNSYTVMYNQNIDLNSSDIVDNKIWVDGRIFFYGSPQYTSTYQGFIVPLVVTNRPVVMARSTEITSNSITMTATVDNSVVCDNWTYILLNKAGTEIDRVQFSNTTTKPKTFTISNLSQNTEYGITVMAVKVGGDPTVDADRGFSERCEIRTTFYVPDPASRITLFPENATDFTTNGLGSLSDAISCTVTEERNGAFELEMEYPIDGQHYYDIDYMWENNQRGIILAKSDPYSKPQPFRIYNITKPFDGIVTINAAHISYDLIGYSVAPFKAKGAYSVLNAIKNNLDIKDTCQFNFWTNMVTSSGDEDVGVIETHIPVAVRTLLGGTEGSVLDTFGGEYEFDGFYVKLWDRRGADTNVVIRYGKNLTDIKQDSNCNNMYSHVRPYWYKEDTDDAGNKKYTLVELTNKVVPVVQDPQFTRILILNLTDAFDDAPTESQLEALTRAYILLNGLTEPVVSINVSFITLEHCKEYELIKSLERVRLCDTLSVIFPKLNIKVNGVKCVKTVFNVLLQKYDSIELGTMQTYLSDTIAKQKKDIDKSLKVDEFNNAIAKITSAN